MKATRLLVAAAILAVCGSASQLLADDQADDIDKLKRDNDMLHQKVKALEEQLNQKFKALEEQLNQRRAVVTLTNDPTPPKLPESTSLFKVPSWITRINLVNDLRMRYDQIYAPDSDFVTRWRIRPRLRLGAIVGLKDDWEIGLRISSTPSVGHDSGGDPLSTNATFEDNASRKPIGMDWAFARWNLLQTMRWTGSVALGKLENPPNYTESIFDVDYTPEGLAQQFAFKMHPDHTLSTYFGQYYLDELQFSGKDPYLFLEQLRVESNWGKHLNTAVTVSGLSISSPESLATSNVPDSNHGNTRDAAGVLQNEYQLAIADGSITSFLDNFPLYHGPFPIKLVGEYIHNFGAADNNIGYSFGPSFGRVTQTGKVLKGNWEISYRYQEMQSDANYEELTASDVGAFYRARPVQEPGAGAFRPAFLNGVNIRGHAFRVAYAATDSLVMDGRVWLNQAITGLPENTPQSVRLLVDLVWKF